MKTRLPFFILHFGLLLLIFLNINESNSQPFWEWGPKTPLTDSVSDNTNLFMLKLYSGNQSMLHMVWENSTDPASSAIYYRNLLSSDEPQALVSEPGIHFTHPKIQKIDGTDILFYVFYQSDQNGNQDIYYLKYTTEGLFTGPFPFATGEGDETGLVVDNDTYLYRSVENRYIITALAWLNDEVLMSCDLEQDGDVYSFSEPAIIDSGNCSNPVVSNDLFIYYVRQDDAGRFIYLVQRLYPSNEWSEPYLYFDQGDCYNLSEDKVEPRFITWSADSNDVYRNYISDAWPGFEGYAVGPGSDTPLDPAICTIAIAIDDQPLEFYDYYMAFPYTDNGNNEIFLNSMFQYPPEYENFSQSSTENRNPEFYLGESDSSQWECFYVYLTWEELRNNHWQIFNSRTFMCYGGIEENELNEDFLETFPNPFRDEVTVSYTLSSDESIIIEVIDLYGRKIRELYSGKQLAGGQQIQWNGKDIPPGLYFIRLSSDRISSSTRVLKIN